jgi:ligand-binding SRPBCC domain-containing protein
MSVNKLVYTQKLPISVETAWDFLSDPANLNTITPPDMSFEITTDYLPKMYQGMIITYKVSPFKGVKMDWVTEITHVQEGVFFVDEQRFGPYAFWHHQHWIKPIEGGVEMTDIIHYKAPFGLLGKLVTPIIVLPRLKQIFDYRVQKLSSLFGEYKEPKI